MKNKFHQPDLFHHDIIPIHNPNNFISLELPGIAHGRKQSLLEYERRAQRDPTDSEWLNNSSHFKLYRDNYMPISNSMDPYWDGNVKCDSSLNDKMWNMNHEGSNIVNNSMESPLSIVEKSWNQIEVCAN